MEQRAQQNPDWSPGTRQRCMDAKGLGGLLGGQAPPSLTPPRFVLTTRKLDNESCCLAEFYVRCSMQLCVRPCSCRLINLCFTGWLRVPSDCGVGVQDPLASPGACLGGLAVGSARRGRGC
ncbi:unnamed protein product [Natator depressus]